MALLYQLNTPFLKASIAERLLGEKGGLDSATEVSFFPQIGKTSSQPMVPHPSSLDVPSKQSTSTSPQPMGDSLVNKKGIGAGGTATHYQAVLHAYLDSVKVYPRHLKDLGLSGIVRVRFDVTRDGYLENIRVGEALEAPLALQTEALRFLKRLAKVPVPPEHFSEAELQFELPLRYELKS